MSTPKNSQDPLVKALSESITKLAKTNNWKSPTKSPEEQLKEQQLHQLQKQQNSPLNYYWGEQKSKSNSLYEDYSDLGRWLGGGKYVPKSQPPADESLLRAAVPNGAYQPFHKESPDLWDRLKLAHPKYRTINDYLKAIGNFNPYKAIFDPFENLRDTIRGLTGRRPKQPNINPRVIDRHTQTEKQLFISPEEWKYFNR
jgi:hypothetical protein